jgi:hypothetical protein
MGDGEQGRPPPAEGRALDHALNERGPGTPDIFEPAITSRAIEAGQTLLSAAVATGLAFGLDLRGTASSFLFGLVVFAFFGSAISVGLWMMLRKGRRIARLPPDASVRPTAGILREVAGRRVYWDVMLVALTLLAGKYGAGILVGVAIVGPLSIAAMSLEERRQRVRYFMTGSRGFLGMPRSSANGPRYWVTSLR